MNSSQIVFFSFFEAIRNPKLKMRQFEKKSYDNDINKLKFITFLKFTSQAIIEGKKNQKSYLICLVCYLMTSITIGNMYLIL